MLAALMYSNTRTVELNIHAIVDRVDFVPETLAEWRPQEGKFSIRELILHLGFTEMMFWGVLKTNEWRYAGHDAFKGASVLDAKRYLEECHKEAVAGLEAMSPSDLMAVVAGPAGEEVVAMRYHK